MAAPKTFMLMARHLDNDSRTGPHMKSLQGLGGSTCGAPNSRFRSAARHSVRAARTFRMECRPFSSAWQRITRMGPGRQRVRRLRERSGIDHAWLLRPGRDAAVRAQLESGVIFSLPHPIEAEVAEIICEMVPCAEMVRFGKNGSDATAGAIRLARAYTGPRPGRRLRLPRLAGLVHRLDRTQPRRAAGNA